MFALDFWRSSRWHSLTAGDPGSPFYFTGGPSLVGVSQTAIAVEFSANVVCQAYIQWALTEGELGTATGWTNSPGEESFDYSTHVQSATGLFPATTYYIRAIITDAFSNVLTSNAIAVTTAGISPPPPSDTVGPRYDLYGAGASGDFPALGTEPLGGGSVAWNAANVRIVPDSVANASDVSAAMRSWLMDTTAVPNGASAASPTYIVFDRSHAGESSTQYGAGTSYALTERLMLTQGAETVRSNLCFWGYNTRLDFSNPPGTSLGLLGFQGGGWENCYVLGFEFDGPGSGAMSWENDGMTGAVERDKAIDITSWSGCKMMDCYAHHCSELIATREWAIGNVAGQPYSHYGGWSHGPYSNDLEIGYNELSSSMNQGVIINGGWNIDIHHNYIHDVRQKLIDFEDENRNPVGSPARRIVNVTIRDNRFGDWVWQSPSTTWNACFSAVSLEHRDYPDGVGLDRYENVKILDNWFAGQQRGMGNPDAEIALNGWSQTLQQESIGNRSGFAIVLPPSWQRGDCCNCPKLTVTITGNVSTFPQWMVDLNGVSRHWGHVARATGVTIEDNDFQDMDWFGTNATTITSFDRNGTSTYIPY